MPGEIRGPDDPTRLSEEPRGKDTDLDPPIEVPAHLLNPPLPASFGRYLVVGELGRGGMGVVLKCFDTELRRHVALKVIARGLAHREDVVARFVGEAHVTAQLQHPAIVPVFDVGHTPEGDVFYTMRLVRGRTLDDLLEERGKPSWSLFRVLQAYVQVCRALAYAHERGVVHRDLKPSNIMIGRFGEVHVMDWGLAKVLDGPPLEASPIEDPVVKPERDQTLFESVLGTPGFMAPEQARGQPAGPLADVYALGAILYMIVTGRPPHLGTVTEVLSKLVRGTAPEPPSVHEPKASRTLEDICLRALAADPLQRIPSAEALAEAIEAYLEGRPVLGAARPEDAEFLRTYRTAAFRRPSVTVDLVVLTPRGVLLIRRAHPPFEGLWALPGSFLQLDETLEEAAHRTLLEELGVPDKIELEQLGAFGDPGRDPRGRVITTAYLARFDHDVDIAPPPEHAREIRWFPVGPSAAPIDLAFDHAKILAAALARA